MKSTWQWLMAFIQSVAFTTQSAHFFAGWAVTLTIAQFLSAPWLAPILFTLLWSAPKELVFDAAAWGEAHGGKDWLDFGFYSLGAAVAMGVLLFKIL